MTRLDDQGNEMLPLPWQRRTMAGSSFGKLKVTIPTGRLAHLTTHGKWIHGGLEKDSNIRSLLTNINIYKKTYLYRQISKYLNCLGNTRDRFNYS